MLSLLGLVQIISSCSNSILEKKMPLKDKYEYEITYVKLRNKISLSVYVIIPLPFGIVFCFILRKPQLLHSGGSLQ